MHLLRNNDDWHSYKEQTKRGREELVPEDAFGHGPKEFPCLVATYYNELLPMKIAICYAYQQDAADLLNCCDSGKSLPAAAPMDPRETFRSMSAHILTITHFLVETGICKAPQYEAQYIAMLARVDQWSTDDANRGAGAEQMIMDSIRRPS